MTRAARTADEQRATGTRLWRARRRHDHIDAVLSPAGTGWELRFLRNGRLLLSWRFPAADAARAEADARLRSLQRAGWTVHW